MQITKITLRAFDKNLAVNGSLAFNTNFLLIIPVIKLVIKSPTTIMIREVINLGKVNIKE
jgi:hypothetical protein